MLNQVDDDNIETIRSSGFEIVICISGFQIRITTANQGPAGINREQDRGVGLVNQIAFVGANFQWVYCRGFAERGNHRKIIG